MVVKNRKEVLITKAKSGDIDSMIELSNIYISMRDEKSMAIAIKLLRYAASQNSYIAHAKLGVIYCHKKFSFYNYDLGIKHLKIAASNNIVQAKEILKKLNG